MSITGLARIGACLLSLVLGASSQTYRPFSPNPSEPLIDRVNPMDRVPASPLSDAVQHELKLAGDYMAGRGVAKDAATAAHWYRTAADQGDPAAQNQLGFLYLTGVGVQPNDAEAFKWFARAAGSGFQPAKLNLAVMYMHGQGVTRDTSLGLQMLQDLAAKDDPIAEDYLGVAYFTGMGVNIDHSAAEKWFARAARRHEPEAEFDMGLLESTVADHPHDFVRAARYLRSAAQAGYVPAMHSLAVVLVLHPEVPHKPDEIEKMLLTAARAGFWRSSATLGVLAREGKGRSVDQAEAYRWFLIAAGQGGAAAAKLLANDLAVRRAALDPAVQTQEQQQAGAWVQQYGTKCMFVFGDRYRSRGFPIAEIREPLSLTAN